MLPPISHRELQQLQGARLMKASPPPVCNPLTNIPTSYSLVPGSSTANQIACRISPFSRPSPSPSRWPGTYSDTIQTDILTTSHFIPFHLALVHTHTRSRLTTSSDLSKSDIDTNAFCGAAHSLFPGLSIQLPLSSTLGRRPRLQLRQPPSIFVFGASHPPIDTLPS